MRIRFTTRHLDFAALLLYLLTLLGLAILYWQLGGVDFRGYYTPALLATRGGNPYDYGQLAPVLEEVTGFAGNNPFFYPPYFILIFLPFLLLPFEAARLAWLLLSAFLFIGALEILSHALGWEVKGWRKWILFWLLALLLAAICLRSEQATVLVLFGLALFLDSVRRRQAVLAGLGALLMTVKPQVSLLACLFAALWLLRWYRRGFWAGAAWLVGLTGMATILMPRWWSFDRTHFGSGLFYTWDGAEALTGLRVNATLMDFLRYAVPLPQALQITVAALVVLAGTAVAWLTLRRDGPDIPYLPISGLVLLNLLVTPYALQYDYILLSAPLLWLFSRLPHLPASVRLTAGLLVTASFATLLLQSWSYQGYWQLLFLFAAFALVLGLDESARRRKAVLANQ